MQERCVMNDVLQVYIYIISSVITHSMVDRNVRTFNENLVEGILRNHVSTPGAFVTSFSV